MLIPSANNDIYKPWALYSYNKPRLVQSLLACPCISGESAREVVIRQLPVNIQRTRMKDARRDIDVQNLVDTCERYPGGIESLIDAVHSFDHGTLQMQNLYVLLQQLLPLPVSWQDLGELKTILSNVSITDEVMRLCWSCIPTEVTRPRGYDKGDMLADVLHYLAKRGRLSNGTAPILLFLLCLIQHITESPALANLNTWMESIAEHLEVDLDLIRRKAQHNLNIDRLLQSSTHSYLLVKIEQSFWDANLFSVKGWLFRDKRARSLPANEAWLPLEDIPEVLGQLIAESWYRLRGMQTELVIEFLLPRKLLCHNVDQWKIHVSDGSRPMAVGSKYLVVVRSYDRIYDVKKKKTSTWNDWHIKWSSLLRITEEALTRPYLFCSEKDWEYQESFLVQLMDHSLVCLVLAFVPQENPYDKQDVLVAALDAGTPVLLWHRQYTEALRKSLEDFEVFLSTNTISHLPELVLHKRREAIKSKDERHPGYHLTLLWDDPGRLPPDAQARYFRAPY